MSDPFGSLFGSRRPLHQRLDPSESEQIEPADRVAQAAALIRDQEIRLWFERDWQTARAIARLCPECCVCSIPWGAYQINALDKPPPWRRSRKTDPTL
jgi:hypothetical protein